MSLYFKHLVCAFILIIITGFLPAQSNITQKNSITPILKQQNYDQLSLNLGLPSYYSVALIKTEPIMSSLNESPFDFDETAYSLQFAPPDPMLWLKRLKKVELLNIDGLYLVEFQEIRYHYSAERLHFEYHMKPYQQSVIFSFHYYLY